MSSHVKVKKKMRLNSSQSRNCILHVQMVPSSFWIVFDCACLRPLGRSYKVICHWLLLVLSLKEFGRGYVEH